MILARADRPPHLEFTKENLQRDLAEGLTVKQLVTKYQCGVGTMRKYLKVYGLNRKLRLSRTELEDLVYNRDYSAAECAEYFKVPVHKVYKDLRHYGLKIPPPNWERDLDIYREYKRGVCRSHIARQRGIKYPNVFEIIRKLEELEKNGQLDLTYEKGFMYLPFCRPPLAHMM